MSQQSSLYWDFIVAYEHFAKTRDHSTVRLWQIGDSRPSVMSDLSCDYHVWRVFFFQADGFALRAETPLARSQLELSLWHGRRFQEALIYTSRRFRQISSVQVARSKQRLRAAPSLCDANADLWTRFTDDSSERKSDNEVDRLGVCGCYLPCIYSHAAVTVRGYWHCRELMASYWF